MVWKKVNNTDPGDATHHGGDSMDKVSDLFSAVDIDNVDVNSSWTFRNGKLKLRDSDNSNNYIINTSNLTADRNVTEPLLTGDDTRVYQAHTQTLSNKTLDSTCITPGTEKMSYLLYNDAGTYKARKSSGTTLGTTSTTNVTVVLDAIIADMSAGAPTVIEIGPGDFNMTTIFDNITSSQVGNITIRGQGMGVTNLIATSSIASGSVIDIAGAVSGSQTNLTGNAVAGSVTIDVADASTFAVGDTILLRSTAAFSTASSAQGKKGEIKKIVAKSSNNITLDTWTHDTYNTADTAGIIKVLTLKDITLENFTLKAGSGYTGTSDFFSFYFCDNLRINNVKAVNHPASFAASFDLISCINWKADVVIEQTPDNTFNNQYGFKPVCASENGHANIIGIGKFRHLVTIDASASSNKEGQVRNVSFSGTGQTNAEATWDTHATGENISFRNCNVHASRSDVAGTADAKGFQMRAKRCNIENCNVWEGVGKGITLSEDASGSIVSGCNIVNARETPGNNSLGFGVEIRDGVNDCVISGNQIIGSKREGILIRTTSSGHVITGNRIRDSGNEGIDCTDNTNTVVSGNVITNNSKALNMTGTSDYWVITGNSFHTNTSGSTIIGANTINQNNTT